MRVLLLILDSLGVGELPDAFEYGDEGSNTLAHIAESAGGLILPNLEQMGLGNLGNFPGVLNVNNPVACYGKMAEASKGKDTTTGHWELAGLILDRPFPLYPDGFPGEIVDKFKERIKRDIIGNIATSGTEIIKKLGEEHIKTGFPIIYTSADSVFQIAAHEEVVGLDNLYEMCQVARQLLQGKHGVARVIARPFRGKPGSFYRTSNRRDYSIEPVGETVLDKLYKKGIPVIGIGKIYDIFAGRGITESIHTENNEDGFRKTMDSMEKFHEGLIFVNFIDFDTLYGHRNDSKGYARALMEFDALIPELIEQMLDKDLMIITADHGCDPTTKGTDHSREYVPLLVYSKVIEKHRNLGLRSSFSDVAQSIAEFFGIERIENGKSFLSEHFDRGTRKCM